MSDDYGRGGPRFSGEGYPIADDERRCRTCSLPIRWSGATWLHDPPTISARALYEFTQRTSDHRAEL